MESYTDLLEDEGIVVEGDDEYKSFTYSKGTGKNISSNMLEFCLQRIKKICGATYWNCVHVYITGYDKITNEEFCISNHTLDIPFKNVSIIDIQHAFSIIFDTLFQEPKDYEVHYTRYGYYNAITIRYVRIVMKRTKPEKKKNRRKPLSNRLRMKILERDNYACVACGRTPADGVVLQVDHINPVSKGGTNDEDNLQTLCRDCNMGKFNHLMKGVKEKRGENDGED